MAGPTFAKGLAPVASIVAEPPRLGGMHTLRHIEARLQEQFEAQEARLMSILCERAHLAEESAWHRAHEFCTQQSSGLHSRIDDEVPAIRRHADALADSLRDNLSSHRGDMARHVEGLARRASTLESEQIATSDCLKTHDERIQKLEHMPSRLWLAVESVREELRRTDEALQKKINQVQFLTAKDCEEKWGRRLDERISHAEKIMREVDTRAKEQAGTAMDTVSLVEKTILSRVEAVRRSASEELGVRVAEVEATLRMEVKDGMETCFSKPLEECRCLMDSKLGLYEAALRGEIHVEVGKAIETADRFARAEVTTMSSALTEAIEATRGDVRAQEGRVDAAVERWCAALEQEKLHVRALGGEMQRMEGEMQSRLENLAMGTQRLSEQLVETRSSLTDAAAAAMSQARARPTQEDLNQATCLVQNVAEEAMAKVKDFSIGLDHQRTWLEAQVGNIGGRCQKVEAEAGDARARMHKEIVELDSELKTVRLASTSLVHGVLRAFQVLGLLRRCEPDPRLLQMHEGRDYLARSHATLEISDLLLWERQGLPLAARVTQSWRDFESQGIPSVLALIDQKATEQDLTAVRSAVSGRHFPEKPIASIQCLPTQLRPAGDTVKFTSGSNSDTLPPVETGRVSFGVTDAASLPSPLNRRITSTSLT
eukprot:TRINITY_DN61750_c0_g1_i1.p1 TRINITY_DN61750_c0_g1~~TRINITY_DN61750_c0_g1_i1.p1  ORF type:complete len:693 (+),score=122.78 TRINITY_DN61750_c0_g1_i1:110-2080(+)